jgi:hypothetical protein
MISESVAVLASAVTMVVMYLVCSTLFVELWAVLLSTAILWIAATYLIWRF